MLYINPRTLIQTLTQHLSFQTKMAPNSSFDPTKPSTPISYPISDLADLESRSYFESFHYPFNKASVPSPSSAAGAALPGRRRILVCHDMMGGYVDDRWVQGGDNAGAYSIWHWHLMDVFVYFSHNLVTIPPPCWTNAGHAHGVKVLGTFILEWEKGAEMCKILLATKDSAQMYADRLAELASSLGFDGWLINVEVDNLNREQVANLKEFVDHLTQIMHSAVRGSLIIWYDSMTIDGQRVYQNQLNENNKPFFDLCDGIFVNYFWQENGPKVSAVSAGCRRYDVYMGIDVFGRKTYGGGGWSTNVALDLLREDDISAAIFAPGWVYENLPKDEFQSNQNRWWGLIKQSWGILHSYLKVLPFYSNFDQGHGLQFSIKGLQVAENPWNNISCQGIQPLLEEPVLLPDKPGDSKRANIQVFINFDQSYNGGGNITCKGNLGGNEFFTTRIFQAQLPLRDLPVTFTYSVKSNGNSQMSLLLQSTSESDNKQASIFFVNSDDVPFLDKLKNQYGPVICVTGEKTKRENLMGAPWILHESSIVMNDSTITNIYLCGYMKKQDQEEPTLDDSSDYFASLGHISIKYSSDGTKFPSADSWSTHIEDVLWIYDPDGTKKATLTLIWELKEENAKSVFTKYNIYVQKLGDQDSNKKFLGVARVERFYVSDLEVPIGGIGVKFIVQPCGPDGACQEVDQCPAQVLAQ